MSQFFERRILLNAFFWTLLGFTILGASTPPKERIQFDVARKDALQVCEGKVASSSLGQREESWIYEFEIKEKHGRWCIVSIDALTGKVLSTKKTSPDRK